MAEQQYGIRKWLNDQGYNNDQIGYSNGNVTLNGKNFINATPQSDNLTYSNGTALQQALGNYRTNDYQTRSNNYLNNYESQISKQPQLLSAPKPFSYDANNDQVYQNALQNALKSAETATNNALVSLGRRGISNSSSSVTQAAGIQQNAVGDVNSRILPQLINQAYERYKNENDMAMKIDQENYNRNNTYNNNLLSLADIFNNRANAQTELGAYLQDREYTNKLRAQADQDRNIKLARDLENQYGVQVKPMYDYENVLSQVRGLTPLAREIQNYNREVTDAGLTGMYKNAPTMQQRAQDFSQSAENRRIGLQAQGQAQSAYNAADSRSLAWAKFNQENDRNSLDNQYKQAQIDSLRGKSGKVDYQKNPGYSEDLTFIYDNPKTAVTEIQKNVQSLIAEYGQDGYNALLKEAQRVQRAAENK